MKKYNLILASGSPRRVEMMKNKGFDPVVMPADVNEKLPFHMKTETAVMYLALKKALAIDSKLNPELKSTNPIIIAADTVVYYNKIIGKPKNQKEASEILTMLLGKSHYVITGVSLIKAGMPVKRLFYEITKVSFKSYTKAELDAYVKTDEPYDKAGGYAVQGTFGKYVDRIEGDLDNVIGLPWSRVEAELYKL